MSIAIIFYFLLYLLSWGVVSFLFFRVFSQVWMNDRFLSFCKRNIASYLRVFVFCRCSENVPSNAILPLLNARLLTRFGRPIFSVWKCSMWDGLGLFSLKNDIFHMNAFYRLLVLHESTEKRYMYIYIQWLMINMLKIVDI